MPFSGALSDEHDAVGAALGIVVGATVGSLDGDVDGATVEGPDVGDAVGTAVGEDVSHVGTASDDQATEPTPTTLHVRVVATLIANPAKQ